MLVPTGTLTLVLLLHLVRQMRSDLLPRVLSPDSLVADFRFTTPSSFCIESYLQVFYKNKKRPAGVLDDDGDRSTTSFYASTDGGSRSSANSANSGCGGCGGVRLPWPAMMSVVRGRRQALIV
jgi:hypothetical protein